MLVHVALPPKGGTTNGCKPVLILARNARRNTSQLVMADVGWTILSVTREMADRIVRPTMAISLPNRGAFPFLRGRFSARLALIW